MPNLRLKEAAREGAQEGAGKVSVSNELERPAEQCHVVVRMELYPPEEEESQWAKWIEKRDVWDRAEREQYEQRRHDARSACAPAVLPTRQPTRQPARPPMRPRLQQAARTPFRARESRLARWRRECDRVRDTCVTTMLVVGMVVIGYLAISAFVYIMLVVIGPRYESTND